MANRDYFDGMDLGVGYNPLTGAASTSWVDFGELTTAGGQTGQTAELLFKRVTSSAELSKVLGMDAEVNLSASWFKIGGSFKAKACTESSRKINEYSTFSVLYVKVRGMAQNLRDVDLKPQAIDFITNKGMEAFFRRAGYEYISGIIPGGEFISTIEIISNDIETKEKIDAHLSAQISFSTVIPKIGAIDANAELKSKFAELAKYNNVRIEARCYRKGGVGAISTTPEEALEYAVNFPASVQQSADILQVICKPYHELISFPDEFDTIAVERQQRVLRSLWDCYQKVTKSIADVDYILQYPIQFDGVEEGILRAGKQQLEQQLDEIADRAMNYAKNPTHIRVEGSDFATILLSLPPRKVTPQPEPLLQTEDSIDAVALESEQGIDYRQLRDLLKAEKWREADEETRKVMFKAVNRESEGFFDVDSLKQFPCQDLHTIDRLWVTASKGHFGFSVQKKIWQECGSPIIYGDKDWTKFGDYIGWRKGGKWSDYQSLKFAGRFSPKGELPGIFVGTFLDLEKSNLKEDIKSLADSIIDPFGINKAAFELRMAAKIFSRSVQKDESFVSVLFSRAYLCERLKRYL